MLRFRSCFRRFCLLGLLAALLSAPAHAAGSAYLIHDRSDTARSIFSVSNAAGKGSAGILIVQEDGQSYTLPVYRADPGCTITLVGQAAQLRVFPVTVSGGTGVIGWMNEVAPSIGQMQVTLADGVRTIAASEFKNYTTQLAGSYQHQVGAGFQLQNPGYYLVSHSAGGLAPSSVVVRVTGNLPGEVPLLPDGSTDPTKDPSLAGLFGPVAPTTPGTSTTPGTAATPGTPTTATPSASVQAEQNSAPVMVDGKRVLFDAYTIREGTNGYTYFKLRDLAAALSGSAKQYEVLWDKASGNILLTSGQPYTAAGGELAPGEPGTKTAVLSTSTIYRNGVAVSPTAYLIGQSNYFKLRDIGALFDFSVAWDNSAMCIVIDTTKPYTP